MDFRLVGTVFKSHLYGYSSTSYGLQAGRYSVQIPLVRVLKYQIWTRVLLDATSAWVLEYPWRLQLEGSNHWGDCTVLKVRFSVLENTYKSVITFQWEENWVTNIWGKCLPVWKYFRMQNSKDNFLNMICFKKKIITENGMEMIVNHRKH